MSEAGGVRLGAATDEFDREYSRILDAAPDGFVLVDAQGVIRLVNSQTEKLFGYRRDELLGAPVELLVPERFRQHHVKHRTQYASAPQVRAMGSGKELYGRRRDGTEFPIEISLSPLETARGRFVASAIRDISERKSAELATALLAAIVGSSTEAIISMDEHGVITSWNQGAERVFGYTASEAVGQTMRFLMPDAHDAQHRAVLERVRSGEIAETYEGVRRRKDGVQIHISVTMFPVFDRQGKLMGISKIARDISDQKRSEALAALASQRLRSAIESIQGMFALYDRDDRLVTCNSDFRQFFAAALPGPAEGCRFREIVDASLAHGVFDLGGESEESWRKAWEAYHRWPTGTLDLRTREGLTLRIAERRTAEGGVVSTVWDITDDVRLGDELRRAREGAEAASAAKSEFLSSMSHELRTPLNAILGFAQLLWRDKRTPLTDKQKEKVDHIVKGGEHLLRLIDDVLDLARIEAGRITMSVEPVVVGEVLREVHTTLAPMAERAQVSLEIGAVPLEGSRVLADRTRFAQVLMNFGSNAIKYGRPGGSARFEASLQDGGVLRITVVDDGQGIPLDKQDKIFQPFQRAGQELGPIEGTGIGLTISKRLTELMGGRVGFRSTPERGSEFWIELTIHVGAHQAEERPSAHEESWSLAEPEGQRHTIVYVEDNPSNIAFMRELMEEFGRVELLTAPTAEIGLELVRKRQPQLVIMDINLPGMNGIEAARRLREWPETRAIPVIALTAAAILSERQRSDTSVFDRYLTKPIKVDELLETLDGLLQPKSP